MLLIIREIFSTGAKVIALDEVTVSLSLDEIRLLYDVMRKQKKIGQSFIYISHEIDEILTVKNFAPVYDTIEGGLIIYGKVKLDGVIPRIIVMNF